MKLIPLTQGQFAMVDDEDYDRVNQFKWFAQKCRSTFYAGRKTPRVNGKQTYQLMHVFIMGDNPLKLDIDHMNGDGLNNQKHMLRFCTHQENSMNQKKPIRKCSSIYKGVCWYKATSKWMAYIQINRRLKHLGYFNSEIEAAMAYNMAAIKHYAEFAFINIIK